MEEYLFYNAGRRPNARFRAIMAVLTGDRRCTAAGPIRLHWGKVRDDASLAALSSWRFGQKTDCSRTCLVPPAQAGWPDAGCWRGDEQYGNNWCSFG